MNEIAVVGFAGRFPGAEDAQGFWRNVLGGAISIRPMTPAERLELAQASGVLGDGELIGATAPVAEPELFDPEFFGMDEAEAAATDPQHRLFLEVCWEALEHAGYDPYRVPGLVGAVGGCGFPGYLIRHVLPHRDEIAARGRVGLAVGSDRDSLVSRVCYKLDLRGPALTVQTFSSTSLVAVHLAGQLLLGQEADLMLAGAAAVSSPQAAAYPGMSSPDGSSRCFDAAAGGTVIANAVGVVALKRLADAERDGDTVWAVIEGSATNNDGAARVGYTAPGMAGKSAVAAEALAVAGVRGADLDYIEAQGIANVAGDSIEIAALSRGLGLEATAERPCVLGSVTANIGHAETASGVAGLIKTAYMLATRQLPPQPGFTMPNRTLAAHPQFTVNRAARAWPEPPDGAPRRAAVASYGIGGVNAHVIVREHRGPDAPAPGRAASGCVILPLSARSPNALARAAARLRHHLTQHPEIDLGDVVHTLQHGRTAFAYRLTLDCADRAEAIRLLADPVIPDRPVPVGPLGLGARLRLLVRRGPWEHAELAAVLGLDWPGFRAAWDAYAEQVPRIRPEDPEQEADRVRYALGRAVLAELAEDAEVVGGTYAEEALAALIRGGGPRSAARPRVPVVELVLGAGLTGREGPFEAARRGRGALVRALWEAGVEVRWPAPAEGAAAPRRIPLPTYPFERRRCWLEPA